MVQLVQIVTEVLSWAYLHILRNIEFEYDYAVYTEQQAEISGILLACH